MYLSLKPFLNFKNVMIIPELGKLRQEDHEFKPSLRYRVRPCLKKLIRKIPRWQLEVGSRKQPSYSEILERCWRHTLQA
jgi:hypothetical protein